jgi:hypothetical protein
MSDPDLKRARVGANETTKRLAIDPKDGEGRLLFPMFKLRKEDVEADIDDNPFITMHRLLHNNAYMTEAFERMKWLVIQTLQCYRGFSNDTYVVSTADQFKMFRDTRPHLSATLTPEQRESVYREDVFMLKHMIIRWLRNEGVRVAAFVQDDGNTPKKFTHDKNSCKYIVISIDKEKVDEEETLANSVRDAFGVSSTSVKCIAALYRVALADKIMCNRLMGVPSVEVGDKCAMKMTIGRPVTTGLGHDIAPIFQDVVKALVDDDAKYIKIISVIDRHDGSEIVYEFRPKFYHTV